MTQLKIYARKFMILAAPLYPLQAAMSILAAVIIWFYIAKTISPPL